MEPVGDNMPTAKEVEQLLPPEIVLERNILVPHSDIFGSHEQTTAEKPAKALLQKRRAVMESESDDDPEDVVMDGGAFQAPAADVAGACPAERQKNRGADTREAALDLDDGDLEFDFDDTG